MRKLFTSESVTEGHPDKMADQISDAILDAIMEKDPMARVACETFLTTGMALIAGEKLPDIILRFTKITQTQGAEFGKDGYFMDLSPYFQNPELNYYRKWKMEMLKPYFDETTYDDLQLRQIDTETGEYLGRVKG